MAPPRPDDDGSTGPIRRKSMLFCWECDHASPIEEEGVVHTCGDYVQYACPRCGTVLTERPRSETVPAVRRRPAERVAASWGRVLRSSAELWRVPFAIGTWGTTPNADRCDCR